MVTNSITRFLKEKNYPAFLPKAVFFDMDGVLYDSMKYHAKSWVDAMLDSGLPFTEHDAYMNEGRTGASTIDGVFNRIHGRDATEDEKKLIYKQKTANFEKSGRTEPMPYALHVLKKAQEQQLGIFIVTGSGQPSLLDSLNKDFPGVFHKEKMVTAYDVKYGKPHPEPYLIALQKSGLNPWEVVVVENAPLGVESATAAGLMTIGVNTGPLDPSVLSDNGASVVFDSMQELFHNWDTIFKQ